MKKERGTPNYPDLLTDGFYFTLHNFSDIYGKVILTWAAFSFLFTVVQVSKQDTAVCIVTLHIKCS